MKRYKQILILGWLLIITGTVHSSDLTLEQKLGKKLYTDLNLSLNRNQSCATCHSLSRLEVPTKTQSNRFVLRKQPAPGFVDPANVQNGSSVANGSESRAFGQLNPPSIGYAAFSPEFHWDGELFIGGQFWNGRSKNLVEQAQEPFLNPAEMAMPSKWSVIERLQEKRRYKRLFKLVYGIQLNRIDETDSDAVATAFESMAKAISRFESSRTFNRFNSKFDFEAAGKTQYNESEQRGADLFDGAAKCGECHITEGIEGEGSPALLTDFSYDNLGVPANPLIPGNPAADIGLPGNPNLELVRGEPTAVTDVQGRHKVMSLRNIALTAPYMHNGVFKTLAEVVHFYNTRDVLAECFQPADATNPGFGVTCWPKGEFHETRNTEELGNLGLSLQDEADIVAYLKTFTDNYPFWGNRRGKRDNSVPKGTPSPYAHYPVPEHQ